MLGMEDWMEVKDLHRQGFDQTDLPTHRIFAQHGQESSARERSRAEAEKAESFTAR